MSNVLRITTSTVGYDSQNTPPKSNMVTRPDTKVQAPVVPDQIVRPDARSDSASQNPDAALKFKFQSNFEGFIAQMKAGGTAMEDFAPALFERLRSMTTANLTQEGLQQLQQFIKMIEIEPQNMAAALKEQVDSSLLFQGAFFDLLRQVMKESRSVDLQGGILEFLKRYADMAESEHLLNQMSQVLENLKAGMLSSGKERLEGMQGQMHFNGSAADTAENAAVLKEKILPFLNQYVTDTNDRGRVRENSALLANLTARYENGQIDRVIEKFRELMEYPAMQQKFKGVSPEELMHLLTLTDYEKSIDKNRWLKTFAALIRDGVVKGADPEQKQAFRSAMFSSVLNESVYMPVLHTLVPMKVGNRLMLAEMWVDPDDESGGAEAGERERTVRGLIKFDISEVGYFDLFFLYAPEGNKLRMQLNCPDELAAGKEKIENGVRKILSRNGIKAEELYISNSIRPIPIQEAFPKIFERKNSINVTI